MWTKLQKVGTEMVSLAKSLSEKLRASCHDEVKDELNCKPFFFLLSSSSLGVLAFRVGRLDMK